MLILSSIKSYQTRCVQPLSRSENDHDNGVTGEVRRREVSLPGDDSGLGRRTRENWRAIWDGGGSRGEEGVTKNNGHTLAGVVLTYRRRCVGVDVRGRDRDDNNNIVTIAVRIWREKPRGDGTADTGN